MKPILFTLLTLLPLWSKAQIINGGFETWDSTYVNVYSDILSNTFGIPDPVGGVIDHWVSSSGFGVSQTTDSYAGEFSLILHTWYGYAQEWIYYDDAVNYRPASLLGYYKYDASTIQDIPHGYATIALTRFNGSTNDTIAKGDHIFDPVSSFTPFSIALEYTSAFNPDSVHIFIINADRGCDTSIVCNFLYLDELRLSDNLSAAHEIERSDDIVSIYPNPASDILFIQSRSDQPIHFTLYNSMGIRVESLVLSRNTERIDISAYPADVYYYHLIGGNAKIEAGKMIKL